MLLARAWVNWLRKCKSILLSPTNVYCEGFSRKDSFCPFPLIRRVSLKRLMGNWKLRIMVNRYTFYLLEQKGISVRLKEEVTGLSWGWTMEKGDLKKRPMGMYFFLKIRDHNLIDSWKAGYFQKALEMLEPYVGKLTCTVLRGACRLVTVLWAGNSPRLPPLTRHTPNFVRSGDVTKHRLY